MLTTKWTQAALALLILAFLYSNAVTAAEILVIVMVIGDVATLIQWSYPSAQTVSWKSTNFKTILTWEPLPTDYSYTVEFSVVSRDKQRNSNCIRISTTMCDLTSSLTDLNACYVADVLSEPPLGATSDLTEFPYTSSSRFCPSNDTDIGRPDFKLEKVFISKTSIIELTDLDQGESYCFNVQAFIPSRNVNKQLGELSQTQCSDDDKHSIFEVYSVGVIATAILLILVLIIITVVAIVCCRRKKTTLKTEKEGVPLQSV
ncbi:coagulation factor IIIa isoform X4 [Phyllopteryx taeniolatus]|uniref:coagulation factor IIIa isoform X4 n=1 Tax=Phyllopteryx taeniolatus TaxID=161469 RepID=UPI002AD20C96|nr:coagulation factor IIIa isoform X4 [Phyllopteryx taeniolatus]